MARYNEYELYNCFGSCVNFINVKRARFSYERHFSKLHVRSKSCQNVRSYEKIVRLTLMKLTTCLLIVILSTTCNHQGPIYDENCGTKIDRFTSYNKNVFTCNAVYLISTFVIKKKISEEPVTVACIDFGTIAC